ncbi:MAG: riboflavin synthase [Gemmatimonadetes bacterium]|nr:riboflavin synthase [Gemmatimonadota bacterium]MBT8403767.1 riboflavin synthase [Gemmatimonadota bacterium]NNK62091.1 riboflavin synthase [Gemmatimonadota bacterium]
MFTGIVTGVGRVARVEDVEGARRIEIEAPEGFLEGVVPGDSIAVDGACLTPVGLEGRHFKIDAVLSTLERTVAGRYQPGVRVNLERALAWGGRLDGHLVQGHVDGVGHVVDVDHQGETVFLTFTLPPDVWVETILHGSIALNGVSLTVSRMEPPDRVQIAIIPHTWTHTNFVDLEPGSPVNVEGDLLGKYVGRILAVRYGASPGNEPSAPDR